MQNSERKITIDAEYQSEERCVMDGYEFDFISKSLGGPVYRKTDSKGKSTYALVVGY